MRHTISNSCRTLTELAEVAAVFRIQTTAVDVTWSTGRVEVQASEDIVCLRNSVTGTTANCNFCQFSLRNTASTLLLVH